MTRKVREFTAYETGNEMCVEVAHIYGLQRHVHTSGDKHVPGTNIFFDFGIVIFVQEDYDVLKQEIYGIDVVPELKSEGGGGGGLKFPSVSIPKNPTLS